jgi:DNA-binding GntR family transcriptional regulator
MPFHMIAFSLALATHDNWRLLVEKEVYKDWIQNTIYALMQFPWAVPDLKIEATDISAGTSAATIVYESLRNAIVGGALDVGEPLRQDEIARMFGTSRIPVREAITRLEQEGLVTSRRFRGAVVAGISAGEAAEIFDFRALLESAVIAAAVPRLTPRSLEEARRCCKAFFACSDPAAWGELNRRFHYALYRDCGMPYHLAAVDKALDRVDRYLRVQIEASHGMERANAEHVAILAACEAGDADKAAELIRAHIEGAKASLLENLQGAEAEA